MARIARKVIEGKLLIDNVNPDVREFVRERVNRSGGTGARP